MHTQTKIYTKLKDIDLTKIQYDKNINYAQFREIIKTKTFYCNYSNADVVFTHDDKKTHRLDNVLFLSKNDFTQLIIYLFKDFLKYFCQNTRIKHKSVKNFNFKKFRVITPVVFIISILLFLCPYSRYFVAYLTLFYYIIGLFIKNIFIIYGSIKRDDFKDYVDNKKNTLNIVNLPKYTILIPMFKENDKTITQSIKSIQELQYPKHLLDVKLVLEEDDDFTRKTLEKIVLPYYFTQVWTPYFQPRTKPKACNVASLFAEGDILVIFDAEDIPEKDQLLKAVYQLKKKKKVQILQGCLSFYNYRTNLLTQCFNIEYTVWFKILLKIFSNFGIIIPLGGTTNHIRYSFLENHGYWDSYNVTEDLELSIISNIDKVQIRHLNSNTFEWCVKDIKSFIKQRSRWLKGYFLTYLTNFSSFEKQNIKQNLFLHLLVGFNGCQFLLVPYFIISCFVASNSCAFYIVMLSNLFYYISYIFIYFSLLKNIDILFTKKTLIVFLIYPFYFILHVISAWKAFFEIFYKPFYWEKTNHQI